MQPSEEIKQKLDIVDVIRDYMPLKAAGINFRAKCPFHRENTPSFMVSPDKQIFHCFGCGKGGDMFTFVMEMEGVDFVEAMRILAPKAGVELRKQDPRTISKRNKMKDIIELSRRFYHKVFLDSPAARAARDYIKERGLNEETIDNFQIGYAPDSWDALSRFLKQKGYGDDDIFQAGMTAKANSGFRYYDRFRDRIIFPINDVNANTVAFSARINPRKEGQEKMGKYINSPQTMLYDKSRTIFGLDKAKNEIRRSGRAILVEGQMDVITAHQNGYENVVASSGTALTEYQIQLIKRYAGNIYLAFDMDAAGEMAADRGVRTAMHSEMSIKLVELPLGMDPDECIKKDNKKWEQAIDAAKPMMQYYFDKTLSGIDASNVEEQRRAAQLFLPIVARLGNKIEQDYWIKSFSEKIGRDEAIIREILKKSLSSKMDRYSASVNGRGQEKESKPAPLSKEEKLSENLLAIILRFPNLLDYTVENLRIEEISGISNKNLYKNLIFYYNNVIGNRPEDNEALDYKHFNEWLNLELKNKNISEEDQLKLLEKLVFLSERDYYEKELVETKKELDDIIRYLKKIYLKYRMKEIEILISDLEKSKKDSTEKNQAINELMEQFRLLSDEYKELSEN